MDLQLLENRVAGLESRLQELRAAERLFLKAQGLDEEAEKSRREAEKLEAESKAGKTELAGLKGRKANALAATAEALSAKMSAVLPEGKAILEISEEGVWIGWETPDGRRRPHAGLSGGEKVAFDQALSFALLGDGEKVLILEAAEADPMKLQSLLNHLARTPEETQIIVNTWCSPPADLHPDWRVEVVK